MELTAEGLRVLVTGAATGIGFAIAETFLKHGARVHICDTDEQALHGAKEQLSEVTQSRADVTEPSDVDAMFEDVKSNWGGLDVLINNAGTAGPTAKLEDIEPDEWDGCLDVSLRGTYLCSRRGIPLIRDAGGGSIINLSSVGGKYAYPLRIPYSTAKRGIIAFTESLAVEVGPDKIRVNCILPGFTEGERIDRVITAKGKELGISYDEMKARMTETISLRTFVTAQDIANVALFLSSQMGERLTSQAITVDAGVRYNL